MVAHLFGIDCITVTTGLGYVFLSDGLTSRLAKCLYKISLKYPKQVWFLNQEDRDIFVNAKIVSKNQTFLLKGEGVDLSEFCVQSINRKKVFLLIARLLWDKGVGEFVEAANILKKEYPDSHFQILGFINVENPSAISQRQMDLWIDMDIIEYLGTTEDVRPYIRDSTCIVLPSYYREGIPRSLMEAAAMGRPIITTNSVGCKEVVEDGVTGYLCEVKSVDSLVIAMRKIIHADIMHLEQMGMAGRRKMEREYDVNRIIGEYKRTLTDRFKA
jgi:glycosyltransferase involved in cell wall biosynthesis